MAQTNYSRMFPQFRSYSRLNSLIDQVDVPFYDVEFYPFSEPGVDPVFAVVGGPEAIVCRPAPGDTGSIEVIAWLHDDDPEASLNSVTWSQQRETGDPLLIVSGTTPVIKIFDVKTKTLVRTLIGHGKGVNDLSVSPLSPQILTSASMDKSVRFWSLDPAEAAQPTMLICGGEGHKEGILTFDFHQTGRFLLTGGMDHMINLWLIPELPDAKTGTDHPTQIHYPHFSTGAIHTDYVDCVQWHGDLILSKCPRESRVVLWAIENFSSRVKLPEPFPPPTTHEFRPTRSAWNGSFQRLLEFNNPDCDLFFVRFKLYTGPPYRKEPDVAYTSPYGPGPNANESAAAKANGTAANGDEDVVRPLLAVGNERSRISFWDLARIETDDGGEEEPPPPRGRKIKGKASGSVRGRRSAAPGGVDGLAASRSGPVSASDSIVLPGAEHLRSNASERGTSGDAEDSMTGVVATSPAVAESSSSAARGGVSQPLGPPPPRAFTTHSPVAQSPLRTLAPAPSAASGGSGSPPGTSAGGNAESGSGANPPSTSGNSTTTVNAATQAPVKLKTTPRSDPFTPLPAHRSFVVPKINFTIRQIAFSVGGEYMVAVGDQGVIALFQR